MKARVANSNANVSVQRSQKVDVAMYLRPVQLRLLPRLADQNLNSIATNAPPVDADEATATLSRS